MLRIRRVEFRIAEIPILALPFLLLMPDTAALGTFAFWEGVFLFFLLFAFGDMINCLADRDLDAVYKPHLSEAVYGLGVGFVTFQVVASALLAVVISIHLSATLDRWRLAAMTIVGLLLGAAYSVKPVQLKGRGLLQLLCLWAIIFFFPILFISQLLTTEISIPLIVFAAFYGTVQMGVILVNTAEDYPEDLASNIYTTIVTLGLHRGIKLALWLAVVGSVGSISALLYFFLEIDSNVARMMGLLPPVIACTYVIADIGRLNQKIAGRELDESIAIVKKTAGIVPLWITVVAWSMLWSAGVFFFYR